MLTTMMSTKSSTTQSTLLRDLFTGADGTNLTAHTMDVGPGWTQLNGAWTIQGNRARPPAATANSFDTSDSGKANVTATLDVVIAASPPILYSGIVLRSTDASNGWFGLIACDDNVNYRLDLDDFIAGVITTRATVPFVSSPSGLTIGLTMVSSGNTITLTASTGETCQYTSASFNATATKHGVYGYTAASYIATDVDNFLVIG